MANETNIELELANEFASSHPEEVGTMNEKFKVLNDSAHSKAKLISAKSDSLSVVWAEFLHILAEMQSLLSHSKSQQSMLRLMNSI